MFVVEANKYILRPNNTEEVRYKNGNTKDIIKTILYGDSLLSKDTRSFSHFLRSRDTESTLRKIWTFTRRNIRYKIDPDGHEIIKSPAKTWSDRFADCKSMSIFIASILMDLKINYKYRFVSFNSSKRVTHVYIIAIVNGKEYALDAVHTAYNEEVPYKHKVDHNMTKISYVAGLDDKGKTPRKISRKREPIFTGSDGDVNLRLLDRQLEIVTDLVPEKRQIWQKGRNKITNALNEGRYNSGHISGIIEPELYRITQAIQNYKYRQMPAIGDIVQDVIDVGLDDPSLYSGNYNTIYEMVADGKTDALNYAIDIENTFDEEEGGHFAMYDFHPGITNYNNMPQALYYKMANQVGFLDGAADLSLLKRSNVALMAENGILKSNVRDGSGQLMGPYSQISIMQQNGNSINGINYALGIGAIIGLIVVAVGAALLVVGHFVSNRVQQQDRIKLLPPALSAGNIDTAGAEEEDFFGWCWDASAGIYRRAEEKFCSGGGDQENGSGESDKSNLLLPAVGLGALLLMKKKSKK